MSRFFHRDPLPLKTALTIASSDSGGGAGIQADLKTFAAFGAYGLCCLSSVTAQNTTEVAASESVSPDLVTAQLWAIFSDFKVDAVKIGLIGNARNTLAVVEFLKDLEANGVPKVPVVVDPVMVSASGHAFLGEEAVSALKDLFRLSTLVTPNAREAARLSGFPFSDVAGATAAAERLMKTHNPGAVLLKGGHLSGSEAVDILLEGDGTLSFLTSPRLNATSDHGTGCTLSSAIAACLALGLPLKDATLAAKSYVHSAMREGLPLGKGRGPLHHFHGFYGYSLPENRATGPAASAEAPAEAAKAIPIRDETPETAIPSFPEGVPGAPAHRASFPGGRGARGGGPGGGWGGWRGKHLSRAFAPPFLTSHPFAENLGKVREKSPLILCLTNFVTVADCANALLAIGASPVMSLSPEDAGEIAAFAAGVVLNIGTLNDETLASMKKAAEIARARKIPVILDPAGVGATSVRKKAALWLAEIAKPAVIRGNSQEILALAGTLGQRQKGVDSDSAQNLGELAETAKTLAKTTGAVIGATGETDVVANAEEVIFLKGGSPLMTKLTGTGCVLSAVVGAFVGARPQNPLDAAASAMSFLKLAGERAEKALSPPGALGELKARLHDALSLIR